MAKQQMGLRIDRVLYKQFQQLCVDEKLRPGEAIETLVRVAIENGSIVAVSANLSKQQSGPRLYEALFRSKLARLRTCLEGERKYWAETQGELEEPDSETIAKELAGMAGRRIDEGLVKEYEACLMEADKLYADVQKSKYDRWIKQEQH